MSQEGGMPGMPYHLEKGRWGAALEDYLNGDDPPRRALETLKRLRTADRLTELPFFDSPALDFALDERYGRADLRRRHFDIDWFGYEPESGDPRRPLLAQLPWTDQFAAELPDEARVRWDKILREVATHPASAPREGDGTAAGSVAAARVTEIVTKAHAECLFDEVTRYPETGFWNQYYGDVEGIVRETFASAIEIALGLPRTQDRADLGMLGDYIAGKPTPCRLPIEVFWKCPQRWFEGWVTWRYNRLEDDKDQGDGQVTVVIASPGSGTPLLERPGVGRRALRIHGPIASASAAIRFLARPAAAGQGPSPKGMWVVSHEDHLLLDPPNVWKGSPKGKWRIPPFGPMYVGIGDIVVIQPSVEDGGVPPEGVPFDKPAAQDDQSGPGPTNP